jgi:D-alanine transfer protein
MNATAHSGWLNHGLAVVAAAAVAWMINTRVEAYRAGLVHVPERRSLEYPLHGYMDNYRGEPYLAAALAKSLSDGSSIVLLGSSELTTADHPAKPVNFFNNELHVPLIAIGHAGNQSFSMHAQLIAAGVDLANARLAILVSPSWFVDKSGLTGTELAAFLEYQPSPSLYRIQQRIETRDPLADPVSAYMAEHEHELGSAQPIVQWITRDASATGRYLYAFSQPWNAAIIRTTRGRMLQAPAYVERPFSSRAPKDAFDWRVRTTMAVEEHLGKCTNNRFFVNDAYYAEYVQGKTRQLEPHPFEENRELRDFVDLLDFLKTAHAEPYFVLQPLNPYVYTNLKDVDPTIDRIRQELGARDFSYLDLWVNDTARFRPGTLTDVMHLGPLGWYRIDSAMAAYFP